MRTTFDIPDPLLKAAQKLLGFKSKREVVVFSLQELLRRSQLARIKDLPGKYDFELDIAKSRGREKASR